MVLSLEKDKNLTVLSVKNHQKTHLLDKKLIHFAKIIR